MIEGVDHVVLETLPQDLFAFSQSVWCKNPSNMGKITVFITKQNTSSSRLNIGAMFPEGIEGQV